MKKRNPVIITRDGIKRFNVQQEYDGVNPGLSSHHNGSYLKQSLAETVQETFIKVLECLDLNNELEIIVKAKGSISYVYKPNECDHEWQSATGIGRWCNKCEKGV